MKKYIFGIVSLLMIGCTSESGVPVALSNVITADIAGTYTGVAGYKANVPKWTIKMKIGKISSIEYPSIPCSGSLTLLSHTGNEYIFREKIIKHKKNCIDNGKLKITKLSANSLKWQWYHPSGRKGSIATVKRGHTLPILFPLKRFLKNYNLNVFKEASLDGRGKEHVSWHPNKANILGINGHGYIKFSPLNQPWVCFVRVIIKGEFLNSSLVGRANITVIGEDYSGNIKTWKSTATGNTLKTTIKKGQEKIDDYFTNMVNNRKRRASSQTYSSPSYNSCGSYDTCHQVIESISSKKVKIKCIRGFNTGRTRVMCANSNGKWATGCGFTDVAAHHYRSISEAAKNYCD